MSKILEQLKAVPIFNNSVITTGRGLSLTEWEAAGDPHEWQVVETKGEGDYHVYYDKGYGYLALAHGDTLIAWGKEQITNIVGYPFLIVLDKHVFGLDCYLWSPMEY